MLITCYLFSDRTLQIGHTYYSVHFSTVPLYLNLEDYKNTYCLYIPFVYEVEVNSDDIFGISKRLVTSRAYKIKRKIEPRKIFKNINLSELERKELEAIFKGDITIDEDEWKDYCLPMKKAPYELTECEHRKILAYMSCKWDLATVEIKDEAQLNTLNFLNITKDNILFRNLALLIKLVLNVNNKNLKEQGSLKSFPIENHQNWFITFG